MEPFFEGFGLPVWISWAAPLAALGASALLGSYVLWQRARAALQAIAPLPARPVHTDWEPISVPAVDSKTNKHQPPSVRRQSPAAGPPPAATPSTPVSMPVGPRARSRSGIFRRSERRLALRRGSEPFPVQLSDENARAPSFPAHILDRSKTGLCIAVTRPIAAETILSVRSEAYADAAVWVQIRVRHCRQRDAQWLLGCSFVSEQPWSVLLLFG